MSNKFLRGTLLVSISLILAACSEPNSSNNIESKASASETPSSTVSSVERSSSASSSSSNTSSQRSSSSSESKGSSSSSSSSSAPVVEDVYPISFETSFVKDEEGNPITLAYNVPKAYLSFEHNSNVFKKELALASLPFVVNAPFKDDIKDVYESFGFDNLVYSNEYNVAETETTLLYTIGHKKVGEYDVISYTLAGHNYLKPWKKNMIVGESGDHEGFHEGALKAYTPLTNYLNNYQDMSKVKLYINGYSRTAAIANLLSTILIDQEIISEDNLYAYLFETPQGLDANNTKEYNSIFNIVNSGDLVTYVAPSAYGLKRAGVDVELYRDDLEEVIASYGGLLPTFTAVENSYSNDVEFVNYLVNYLLEPAGEPAEGDVSKDLSTRANYANNAQDDFAYLVTLMFDLPAAVKAAVTERLAALDMWAMFALMDKDGLYNFLAPIFDEYYFQYDATELKDRTNAAMMLMKQKPNILGWVMNEEIKANISRSTYLHALDTVMPLLINLQLD